jgi:hypothetical protein
MANKWGGPCTYTTTAPTGWPGDDFPTQPPLKLLYSYLAREMRSCVLLIASRASMKQPQWSDV